jgi:hypothetical protein
MSGKWTFWLHAIKADFIDNAYKGYAGMGGFYENKSIKSDIAGVLPGPIYMQGGRGLLYGDFDLCLFSGGSDLSQQGYGPLEADRKCTGSPGTA